MSSVLTSSGQVVGSFHDQVKLDYVTGIYCFAAKQLSIALRCENENLLTLSQGNMSEMSHMYISRLLFQWLYTIKNQQNRYHDYRIKK